MRVLLACLMALALGAAPAFGKDDPARMVKDAEALVRSDSVVDAVRVYAAALAVAAKRKDLPAQELVARSMQTALSRGARKPAEGAAIRRAVLLALLEELDPKRNSVFFARGQIAHELLLDATASGDLSRVAEAAAATHAHAKLKKVGAYAQVMGTYADGLVQLAGGEIAKSCLSLQRALEQCTAQGWVNAALHIGTELAAAHAKAGNPGEAAKALAKAADALKAGGDYPVAMAWRRLVTKRLEGADKAILAPYEQALKPFAKGGAVSSRGGSGSKGKPAGSRDRSKLGDAWKKLSKSRPFVTVQRTGEGYAIRQSFDKEFEALQPYEHGVKHHADGGITLSFWQQGVRLHLLDMTGREGQPGEASSPPPFLLFHALAAGETWGVDKSGVVSIAKK